jgi:hypothetical protein
MIRRRASLDSVDQDAISLRVRPQPTQCPERSTTQTLMQGVSITDMVGSQWVGQGIGGLQAPALKSARVRLA